MKTNHNSVVPIKVLTLFLMVFGMLTLSSCTALDRWLFRASDYSIIPSKNEDDSMTPRETDIFWDDWDYDIWYDENEYE